MEFNFKKIATVIGSTLMVGSTVAMAAAANFPAPFVSGGNADVAVVWGAGASSTDIVGAGDIGAELATELAAQTTTTTATGPSTSGGDSVNLGTGSRKMYYNDALSASRDSISYTELGNVLADGTFTDLSGTEYDYTQTVTLGYGGNITFGDSGGDIADPAIYLDAGTTAGKLYNYTLSFTKNVNVSDATDVQGQKITILGVEYVIGASSTNQTIYLYGSGETVVIGGGEETTVSIGGTDHTVKLVTTASATAGTIEVDGVSKSVTEGSSYTYSGDVTLYVKDLIHPAYAGDIRQAELILGSSKLQLTDAQKVKVGADATNIKGTLVNIASTGQLVSSINIGIAATNAKTDDIKPGDSFVDPVFGGLKIEFAGAVPELDSDARKNIVVSTDNNQHAYVTFTSARAGDAGEQKITYTYDNNTASTAVLPLLAHQTISSNNKGRIHVLEGEAALEGDWIVINQGDAGTILEVEDISEDGDGTGSVTFTDVITGNPQTIELTADGGNGGTLEKSGVNFYGGNGYLIATNAANTSVNISWSSGALTVFPRIKLAGGGWMAFLSEKNLTNASDYIFPDGLTSLATSGVTIDNKNISRHVNGITWGFQVNGEASAAATQVKNITASGGECSFNHTLGPAILFIEPKKWDDSSYGNFICVPMSTTGTTEININDPVINGTDSGYIPLDSDTYQKEALDDYGALITKEDRTNENGVATISYPTAQMYYDILFTSEETTVTAGTSSSGTAKEIGTVSVKDTEIGSDNSKNLIVVGGSCINTVAAKLLGSSTPLCGADFTAATDVGAGQFLIETFENPYASDKIAMLVAGYDAADTTKAVTYLRNNAVDTGAGMKYTGTSSTEATLVTDTA